MSSTYRDRLYANYDKHLAPEDGARARALDLFVRRYLPSASSARILDLGCGDGALVRAAIRKGHSDVHGVDTSPVMVARAATFGTHIARGDLFAHLASLAPSSFECIVAFDVLEHIEGDEQLALLDAAHRVLVPRGRLVLHVPNGEGLFAGQVRYGDATHVTAFTATSLSQLLRATGYTELQFHEDAPTFTGFKRGIRAALWQVIRHGVIALSTIETGWYNPAKLVTRNLIAVAVKA